MKNSKCKNNGFEKVKKLKNKKMKKVKKNVEMKKNCVSSEKYEKKCEKRESMNEQYNGNKPFYFEKRIHLNNSYSTYLQIGYNADSEKDERFKRLIRLVGKKFYIDFDRQQFGDFIQKIKSINGFDVEEDDAFYDHVLTYDRTNIHKTSDYAEIEESNYADTFKIKVEGKFLFIGKVSLQSILNYERYIFDVIDKLPEEKAMNNMLNEIIGNINKDIEYNHWTYLSDTIKTKLRQMYLEAEIDSLKQTFIGESLSHFYDFIFAFFDNV